MRNRILIWSGAGFLIALCWAVYALAFPISSASNAASLARFTQPVVLAGSYFHFGLGVEWVLLANAATYALIGALAEGLRSSYVRRASQSHNRKG
jgi:hypothetical protein